MSGPLAVQTGLGWTRAQSRSIVLGLYENSRAMDGAPIAAFILACVLALSLPGCAAGPGFGKAEPDQPPVEKKSHAAIKTKPANEPQPPEESEKPPAPTTPPAIGGAEEPPPPTKPPAFGGSGG